MKRYQHLQINSYTSIRFENRMPVYVCWHVSDLVEDWEPEELVKQVQDALASAGWDVVISKPEFEDAEAYADMYSTIAGT